MEKTRVRYNAGDIFYFIFSVLHKKTPSVNTEGVRQSTVYLSLFVNNQLRIFSVFFISANE